MYISTWVFDPKVRDVSMVLKSGKGIFDRRTPAFPELPAGNRICRQIGRILNADMPADAFFAGNWLTWFAKKSKWQGGFPAAAFFSYLPTSAS
ncbi:MAG TPA: hypothetical protein PKL15_00065 [Saprospiraceae bacterium]|nr:hypothetical protein [Saprospiraceae bacterium]